jgi:hypothetical protein
MQLKAHNRSTCLAKRGWIAIACLICLPLQAEPVALFNGKDLTGWDGPEQWWSVVDGVIIAESTEKNPCTQTNYLTWTGGKPGDFQLDAEFRISADANSGIQILRDPAEPRHLGIPSR